MELAGVHNEIKRTVESYLNSVSYVPDPLYVPSQFALEFVNFIKLVDGGVSENKTPVVHYKMLDNFISDDGLDTINMCHRGIAKTTLKEFLILYIAVYGGLPEFGEIKYGLYVSDSIDNGVKKMRKALEYRYENSEFLQRYIKNINFTDIRWEFENIDGRKTVFSGHGAKTGVRGTRELNSRPVIALLDDLVSDEDARSETVIEKIEDTVGKAIDYALHPKRRKVIWSGTPFNAKDPLYKAVESGAYKVNVYPVCEQFPCTREEFRGSWPDRFDYDYVERQYIKALRKGKIADFNQELMLRIMSDEDRLIHDSDIPWYPRNALLDNRGLYNWYITTDFASSKKQSADFSVISVWAYNHAGHWFWVDGICAKQDMGKNLDDLFRLVVEYSPLEVGIEVSGQQNSYVTWLQREMMRKNCWFHLASSHNDNNPGIRSPQTDTKFERFHRVMVPQMKQQLVHFPEEWKETKIMQEAYNELSLVHAGGFKSKHDDFIDTITQLQYLNAWKPAQVDPTQKAGEVDIWTEDQKRDDLGGGLGSYVV